nr:protein transport protein Sec24A [Leptinotarsa decemlineata]
MMAEQNLNGVSLSLENLKQNVPVDGKMYQQFNGVHSSQSSRSSTPPVRLGQIPPTQLPPNRPVPQSQLPPSRSPLTNVTQQVGALSIQQMPPSVSTKFETISLENKPVFSSASPVPKTQVTQAEPFRSFYDKDDVKNVVPNVPGVQKTPHNFSPMSQTSLNQNSSQYPYGQMQNQQSNVGPSVSTTQGNAQAGLNRTNFIQTPVLSSQNFVNKPTVPLESSRLNQYSTVQSQSNPIQTGLNQGQYLQHPASSSSTQYSSNNTSGSHLPNLSQVNRNIANQIPGSTVPPLVNPAHQFSNPQKFSQMSQIHPSTNQRYVNPNHAPRPMLNMNNLQNFSANATQPKMPPSSVFPPPVSNFQPTTVPQTNYLTGPPLQNLAGQKPVMHNNRYPTSSNTSYQQPPASQYNAPPSQTIQKPTGYQQPMQQQNSYQAQNQYRSVLDTGFNNAWGTQSYDLLQLPNILPPSKIDPPRVCLGQELLDQANCNPDVFRCTMTKIPENNSLLQKSRLPLGILIHPFRDLSHLPVIQCNVIVRCRACRTYINPFVTFVDNKRWKCNLCYRVNELPEEFQYDPVSKTYGDPSRRPEIRTSTLEYIAPAEYMLRPPQPAVYLFLLDVSRLAVESGYLELMSGILLQELKNLPGDARTHLGFIAYDSALHFYSLPEGITQPQEMTVLDIEDAFIPTPDNLLINLKDRMDLIADLLRLLPSRFSNTYDTNSALGAALQVAFKLMSSTGGRVTVFQASLPNVGPGALTAREDPSQRATTEVVHLNPVNDFYKRIALECSGQQIAVDLFVVNSQYVDVATISGISRFSGGCMHHFPLLKPTKTILCESFARCFRRYLTRKIGFEAVMRIRCTRGLSIHTFHGNFFVRSTDLLSLPNINPDAGFGMQLSIDESLSDVQSVCFQAALLYTSSKGERRIRVHTMCLPVASVLNDIIHSADQECIVGLLSKMAVDRSMQSSLSDAREAFINVAIDILTSYKISLNMASSVSGLLAPNCLKLLPLYISALLKHPAFRMGGATRVDDRVMSMINMKTKPLYLLIQNIYPDLYPIHDLENQEVILNSEEEPVSMPPRLQLTARCLENKGAFLMDTGEHMVILVCPNVSQEFLSEALGVSNYNSIPDDMYELPILDNLRNQRLHQFVNYLNDDKPYSATLQVIRDNNSCRVVFFERLIEDRVENALSYHEFLQHLKTQVK